MWLVRPTVREINGMMEIITIVGRAETYELGEIDKGR